jgi:hypothetical protein
MIPLCAKSLLTSTCALLLLAFSPAPSTAAPSPSLSKAVSYLGVQLDERDEGCKALFWKKPDHFASWPCDLHPEMPFSAIFDDAFPGKTMKQVLNHRGPGRYALGRQAVTALLNACSDDVAYGLSREGVIESFNEAIAAGPLEQANTREGFAALNAMGCPLN